MIANLTRDANARVVEFAQLIENMKQDVRQMANRLERIEQKVVIESEEPLKEEEEKKLESLGSFRDYLKKTGIPAQDHGNPGTGRRRPGSRNGCLL